MERCKPIMKWAGGKSQLLKELLPRIPDYSGKYIEIIIPSLIQGMGKIKKCALAV